LRPEMCSRCLSASRCVRMRSSFCSSTISVLQF
jgi:hypothetical protein